MYHNVIFSAKLWDLQEFPTTSLLYFSTAEHLEFSCRISAFAFRVMQNKTSKHTEIVLTHTHFLMLHSLSGMAWLYLRQTIRCLLLVQNVSEIHRWWHDVIYRELIKTSCGFGMRGVILYSLPHAKHVVMWIKWKAFQETVKFGTKTLHLLTNTLWSYNWWILSVLGKRKFCVVLERGCSVCDWEH